MAGATIEVSGSNKVFYTNINGYCYIPKSLLNNAEKVTINCISYKTVQMTSENIQSRIVLKSR
ncbi:MAG: hypothetical protein PSX81_12835 [bacterium]|nr:hypothetical protein [bacterium]